jgi:hypothetical protein
VRTYPAIRRVALWFATPWGLALLFGAGFVLRLLLAPHTGEFDDLGTYFRPWAERLADVGPHHFYNGYIADPPGYLLVLWPLGKLARALHETAPSTVLLKLPSILGDLGLAWVAAEFAVWVTPPSVARTPVVRTVVAAAILFNPAVFFVSSVWGQVDTLGNFLLLSSLFILFTRRRSFPRELGGMALLGLAVAVKPQVAIAAPAVALALVWWHLHGAATPLARWVKVLQGVVAGLTFVLIWGASGFPFAMSIPETLRLYEGHTSINDFTGMWSYNLWGILGPWRHDVQGDSVLYIAGMPSLYFGLILYTVGISLVLRRSWWLLKAGVAEASVFLFTAAAASAMAFALVTRMWERYLMVSVVCLVPLIFCGRLWRFFAALSGALFVSEYYHYVFGAEFRHAPTFRIDFIYRWLLGGDAIDALQRKAISLVVLCLLLWLALRGWCFLRPAPTSAAAPSSELESAPRRLGGRHTRIRSPARCRFSRSSRRTA